MSTPPLTIAGRSPFDHIRFRWGGAGSIALGVAIMFTGAGAGIVFGILLVLLGIATWIFTKFGETSWYDMSAAGRVIAGTGSVIGNAFLYVFLLTAIGIMKLFQFFAS